MKFPVCFKIFDADRDGILNRVELLHMINTLCFVANESENATASSLDENKTFQVDAILDSLKDMLTSENSVNFVKKRSKESLFKCSNGSLADVSNVTVKDVGDQSNNNFEINNICEMIESADSSLDRNESELSSIESYDKKVWGLSQENFLIWHVNKGNSLIAPFLQLIFQVCHIVLGLRPQCKHQEQEIG